MSLTEKGLGLRGKLSIVHSVYVMWVSGAFNKWLRSHVVAGLIRSSSTADTNSSRLSSLQMAELLGRPAELQPFR